MKRLCFLGTAIGFLILSLVGLIYSVRTAIAQRVYCQAKYGAIKDDPDQVLAGCERAHRLYPHNYRFCIWAMETAWYGRHDRSGNEIPERVAMADTWCGRGLELNSYKLELRLVETHLLARESAARAAARWQEYVDWQFWEPLNHALLAELYARAGDFDRATEALAWVEGSKHYDDASRKVREAWYQEWRDMLE